ncbi:MAG: cell division protein FtsZ, partial [Heliobacteriaceae bacterium]|nr:cell division protein FtsZ [Heliobacteriaceae bacterium]
LLETSIEGARGVLMNITGGANLGMLEVNEAAEIVTEVADPEANIIFGAVIDEAMEDEVRVTVIATGFDQRHVQTGPQPVAKENIRQKPQITMDVKTAFPADEVDIPVFLRKYRG